LNLLPKHFIKRHQGKLLLLVIWLHVSLLDFLYVSYRGPVFLYKESLQINTLLTHAFITLLTLACYFLAKTLSVKKTKTDAIAKSDGITEVEVKRKNKVLEKPCE
jgi:hypothetical protein